MCSKSEVTLTYSQLFDKWIHALQICFQCTKYSDLCVNKKVFKRLRLGKTTGWQHRFFDLIILSPIWLGTYEYMKNTLKIFFFRFETGLPEWIFQIWSKIFKSDQVFVYTKKSLFWAFWGPAKVSRPLVITKLGAGSEKTPKNWIGRSGRPKMPRMNFWPVLRRNLKNFWFYWPNH